MIVKSSIVRRFFRSLGPGVVAGAADDDPSGIATYSIAGSQFGMSLLWMAWVTWPLMAAVQLTCARISMATGTGLAGAMGKKFPKHWLAPISFALFFANTINIAADLSGMADAAELLTGVSSHIYVVAFGIIITYAIVRFRYNQIAGILKWLALSLFAYVITAFILKPDWSLVLQKTFLFTWPRGNELWITIVAVLGTTISPYLFFWQSSQEVEEYKSAERRLQMHMPSEEATLADRVVDVTAGTFLSNIVMFFIILTTALTLNTHGVTNISTSREAAEALRPLAGNLAMLLYTTGIIAVGFLAIPTLAGSAAYAFAETFNWQEGLDEKLNTARAFYGVIIFAVYCGIGLDFLNINPIQALFWTAVINGMLAPFLITGIWLVARDRHLMKGEPSSRPVQLILIVTAITMFFAGIKICVS